jgi:hypothetical protein
VRTKEVEKNGMVAMELHKTVTIERREDKETPRMRILP